MDYPADLLDINGTVTTSVTPNTEVDVVILAAPGAATLRYRIWAWSFGPAPADTGLIRAMLKRNASVNFILPLGGSPGNGGFAWAPGGIVLAGNEAIALRHSSNVASQAFRWWVGYTLEATG